MDQIGRSSKRLKLTMASSSTAVAAAVSQPSSGGRRRRRPGLKLLLPLFFSLFLNVFFASYLFLSFHQPAPGWARYATTEAEAAAAAGCSGHGRSFVLRAETPVCECEACYTGDDCSWPVLDCAVDADGEDSLFLEPFWKQHAAGSSVVLPGWHSMNSRDGHRIISGEIERHIHLLHKAASNAMTDGKFIVFSSRPAELLNALAHAVSANNNSSTPPNVVEHVTSLNAREGDGGSPVIFDRSYYWPHYYPIAAPADEGIMLFSISKISGHAGIGFWWAAIKDEKIYQRAAEYMTSNAVIVSPDTQLRVLKLIKVMISEKGAGDIFKFGYTTLKARWSQLHKLLATSDRFSLHPFSPNYCSYFKTVRDPTPAYAWLKCEMDEDKDCQAVLRKFNIISGSGKLFEGDNRYTRLNLCMTNDHFELLMMRMEAMVSKEWISSS
ncbi:tryptophan aminotransferase-related protein 3-like [Zingiber officinale]|nr:tryptophan aminotransferase-related protein 3-like [Zingiber officinale]